MGLIILIKKTNFVHKINHKMIAQYYVLEFSLYDLTHQ